MIALLPFILFLTYRYSFYNPTKMVIFYIILSSASFGFVDMTTMLLGGTDLGFFSVNMLLFGSIFFYKDWYRIHVFIAPIFVVVFILLLYGILGPVLREYESIVQAVTASKSFLYFSLFFYMFVRRDEIDIYKIMKYIKFIGIYLAVFKIIYAISPSISSLITPPAFRSSFGSIAYYVRVYFPTYISFTLFIYFAEWQLKIISTRKMLFMFVFLILGVHLCQHAALTGMTFLALVFIYFVWHTGSEKDSYQTIKKFLFSFFFIIVVVVASPSIQKTILEQYTGISSGDDAALESREKFNRFRWKAINSSPIIGMGFVHKTAPIMKKFESEYKSRFTEKFDVIDSGYVDMLVRFGYGGMYMFLVIFTLYIYNVFRQENPNPYALVAAAYLVQYYPMNYTWSVFTFSHGIIPMSVAFFMIYNFRPKLPRYKVYK